MIITKPNIILIILGIVEDWIRTKKGKGWEFTIFQITMFFLVSLKTICQTDKECIFIIPGKDMKGVFLMDLNMGREFTII